MAIQAVKIQSADGKIKHLLVTLGLEVDEAVSQAIAALLGSGSHFATGVMERSAAIQETELTLDQAILDMLERRDLSPAEISRITSVMNVGKDLSHLGKLAANLGQNVTEVGKHNEHEDFSRLQPLAIAVSHLCRQTLRSLTRLDSILAHSAAQGGPLVDAYRGYVLRGLIGQQARATDEQHLIFASRCLEQIADHAIHLAENLVAFLAREEQPQDRQPQDRRPLAS
jgi:phosphate transport system protein